MNWFSLLKVQRQTQRQGVSARQKDEEFIFEDEDESDCYDEFIRIYENIKNLFPNGIRKPDEVPEGQEGFSYAYDKFVVYSQALIPQKGEIPDEVICAAIELYKNAEHGIPYGSSLSFKNYYIVATKNSYDHIIEIFPENGHAVAFIALDAWYRELIDGAYGPPSSAKNRQYNIDQNIDGWRGSFI